MATMRIAANSASKAEGNTGTTLFTFTVTRSSSVGTASANWSIVHGTTDSADFSGLTSGIVSFANGQLTRTITVSVVGNTLAEASEAFSVLLSNPTNATLTTASASSVITNDDLPRLSIVASAASLAEGTTTTGGTTPYTFTVTRDVGLGTSTVSWAVVNRTTSVSDFSGTTSGTLTFAAGETSRTVTVQVAADAAIEADELFDVVLSRPVGAVIATSTARATLVNDDLHTLSIAATTPSKNEGNASTTPFTFTVTRSAGIGSSTVNWSLVHGTTSAADFSGATSGSVSFASGQTSKVITVYALGDTVFENSEAFSVQLAGPVNARIVTGTASATLVNDDTAPVVPAMSISAAGGSAVEGNSGSSARSFTVTRTAGTGTSSANWSIAHGTTDAADFTGITNGTVSFAEGEVSKTITVSVVGDTLVESDETFSVNLSSPSGSTLGTASATATILNDDVATPTVSLVAASASKAEGSSGTTAFTFTVTRSSGTGLSSVAYQVNPGTATSDDFASGTLSGTVSFAAGETTRTLTVDVLGDTTVEGDETFTVQLSSPVNATLGNATATGTILNDDATVTPTLNLAATNASRVEGNSGTTTPFTFTVTRSDATSTSSVNWLLVNGSTNSTDFAAGTPIGVSSALAFAVGETSKTITVNVAGDATQEGNENFSIQLSSPTNALLGTSTATATILDDDTPVISITATDASKLEGNGADDPLLTFTISRSVGTGTSTVSYRVLPGTALAGSDYYGTTSGSVTFASGELTKTVSVIVNSESLVEADETLQVELYNPSGALLGTSLATGTIRNDDRAGIDGTAALVTDIVVPASVDDSIDNLVDTTKWGGAIGTGVQLTYSFSTASSVFTYASGSEVPFTSLNASQKSAAVMAMNALSAICGVTFVEVADTATSAGDIRWTQSINTALSTAHAYYPSSWAGGGDVWIGPDSSYTNPVVGGYSYHTFIHELGHSMGLDHPHQGSPVPEPGEDQLKYSVMSYRDNASASTTGGYSSNYYPTDYMLNDVLALQYLYGVNTTSNQGDTVYQWASSSPVYDCIWDVGGNDTIDAGNQTVACAINLNGGTWSTIGTTYYNGAAQVNNSLSIAYEVTGVAGVSNVIENAIGSAQADTLIGNAAANRLTGGNGADTLTGGNGADVFFFASTAQGGDTITDFVSGTDRIEVYSANFAGLAVGTLVSSRFVSGSAPVALDGNAVFLYNSSTGQLSFDSNGTAAGGATQIATLSGAVSLNAGDIRIVAAAS
jgi:hypothetical protein